MKTVFSNAQTAHVWAQQNQESGRNGNSSLYFDGATICSYRDSWTLATFTPYRDDSGQRVVIVNAEHYGMTTSRHLRLVRDALRGLPLRVVDVPEHFSTTTAERIARDPANASDLVAECLSAMDKAWRTALAKRCEWRAVYALDAAREWHESACILAKIAGMKAPTLPAGFPAEYSREDVIAILRDAGADVKRADAKAKQAKAIADARDAWRDANDTGNGAHARRKRAEHAATCIRSARSLVKRADSPLPRNLVSLDRVEALVPKLQTLETLETVTRNHASVAPAIRRALENYASAQRGIRRRTARDPRALRETLANPANVRSVARIIAELSRVTHGTFAPAARDHADRRVRAAYAALHADAVRWIAELSPLAARIERGAIRARIEAAQDTANGWTADNLDDTAPSTRLAYALNEYRNAATLREANPELSRGVRVAYSDADVKAVARKLANVEYGNTLTTLECKVMNAKRNATSALESNATRSYSAVSDARNAERSMCEARDAAEKLAEYVKDGATPQTQRAMDAVADMDNVARLVADAVAHARNLESDGITAWRSRDPRAPVPHSTVFRLAANGDIESSRGARVSVEAGARLWRMIRACVDRGASQSWEYGKGPHVGSFQLRAIRADGSATVGCHEIDACEARAFAEFMQWPPFGAETAEDVTA